MADYELSKKNCETVRNLKDNLSLKYMFPVDTMLNNNVIITSNDVAALVWPNNDAKLRHLSGLWKMS